MPDTELNAPFMTIRDVVMEIRADVKGLKETLAPVPARVEDHETRIRGLEKRVWVALGGAIAGGGAAGSIAQIILGG